MWIKYQIEVLAKFICLKKKISIRFTVVRKVFKAFLNVEWLRRKLLINIKQIIING